MKFWKKFSLLVSKPHLYFGIFLFVVVIGTSLIESANKVTVQFGEAAVDIKSTRVYSMNIPYDMVSSVELIEMPDAGEAIKGTYDMTVRYGHWKNEVWGDYVVCMDPDATDCIVVHLDDGRIFVFNRKDNETTAEDFAIFQNYLNKE
jgi:hypothetical protein